MVTLQQSCFVIWLFLDTKVVDSEYSASHFAEFGEIFSEKSVADILPATDEHETNCVDTENTVSKDCKHFQHTPSGWRKDMLRESFANKLSKFATAKCKQSPVTVKTSPSNVNNLFVTDTNIDNKLMELSSPHSADSDSELTKLKDKSVTDINQTLSLSASFPVSSLDKNSNLVNRQQKANCSPNVSEVNSGEVADIISSVIECSDDENNGDASSTVSTVVITVCMTSFFYLKMLQLNS